MLLPIRKYIRSLLDAEVVYDIPYGISGMSEIITDYGDMLIGKYMSINFKYNKNAYSFKTNGKQHVIICYNQKFLGWDFVTHENKRIFNLLRVLYNYHENGK